MDTAALLEFINLVIVGICLCTGYILKHAIPSVTINRFIPLIMGLLGLVMNVWIHHFSMDPQIILEGLISGLASTGLHQAFSNFIETTGRDQ